MSEWIVPDEDIGCDGAYFDYDEVLRCKDCQHYKPFLHKKNRKYCFKFDHVTTANDFCSFAERKEDV